MTQDQIIKGASILSLAVVLAVGTAHADAPDPRLNFCAAMPQSVNDFPRTLAAADSKGQLSPEDRKAIRTETFVHGWASTSLVGRDVVDRLVHTIERQDDAEFLNRMVSRMQACVGTELDPMYFADFNDRVEIRAGRPQQIGSQYTLAGGHAVLTAPVDAQMAMWRGYAGLPPIQQQTDRIDQAVQAGKSLKDAVGIPLRPTLPPLTDHALHDQLITWLIEDQDNENAYVRLSGHAKSAMRNAFAAKQEQLTQRAKAMWKDRPLADASAVGMDGVFAIFLQLQHSTDHAWLAAQAARMRHLMEIGSLRRSDYALYVDRLDVQQGRPQTYGSQFLSVANGPQSPEAIIDPAHLDERRVSMGLGPWDEYAKSMGSTLTVASLIKQAVGEPPVSPGPASKGK